MKLINIFTFNRLLVGIRNSDNLITYSERKEDDNIRAELKRSNHCCKEYIYFLDVVEEE